MASTYDPSDGSAKPPATPAETAEQRRRHRLQATLLKTLWRSEAHRRLAESNILGVVFADLDGRITSANDEFSRMLGYPREELEKGLLTMTELTPPEHREADRRAEEELLRKGISTPREKALLSRTGARVPVLVGVALMEGSDQKTIGFVLDLSERKAAEEKAQRYADELQRRNEKLEEDLRLAREIQQGFLPQHYPTFPQDALPGASALGFCHRYFPAGAVGGDFFDVLALSGELALVIICDVMCHGVRAALVKAMVRTLVEHNKSVEDPGRMLSALNLGLIATFRQTGTPMFVSSCCVVADLDRHVLRFSNAGHPSPIHIHSGNGGATFLRDRMSMGPALGLLEDSKYRTSEVPLIPGDRVMLFTDGLYEIEDKGPEPFTQEDLLGLVAARTKLPLPQLFDELLDEVHARSASGQLLDDACLVGLEMTMKAS
jgi:phosphoserine phosphatase RsbU/P